MRGLPVPPPERRLPDHGRRREELLRMIDQEQARSRLRKRWGLPLAVAAIVSATGVITALALSGGSTDTTRVSPAVAHIDVTATPTTGPGGGVATVPDTPSPTGDGPDAGHTDGAKAVGDKTVVVVGGVTTTLAMDKPAYNDACRLALAAKEGKAPPVIVGPAPPAIDPRLCTQADPATVEPTNPEMHAEPLNPLPPARAAAILASCAPSGGPWQPVIAVNTSIPTPDQDAMVIGVNARHEYAFCSGLGDVGRKTAAPPTMTMNSNRTGNIHLREFESGTDFSDRKNYLMIDWGLVGPEVARVTVSYGFEKREAPALLAGGAYMLTVSTPYNANYTHPPVGYVHAYAADGSKLYDAPVRPVQ